MKAADKSATPASSVERAARRRLYREYLSHFHIPCEHCAYNLRGLNEPRCPECGEWTELAWLQGENAIPRTPTMTIGPLRLHANRICIVLAGQTCNIVDYEELRSMKVVRRNVAQNPHSTVGFALVIIALAMLCALMGIQYAITGRIDPVLATPNDKPISAMAGIVFFIIWPIVGIVGGIKLLNAGMSRRKVCWVEVKTSARELMVPVHGIKRDELETQLRTMLRTAQEFATGHADGSLGRQNLSDVRKERK